MSDEDPSKNTGNERRHRAIDWDAAGTVIAALIGLIAIFVSTYTAVISRRQLRAQVWPHVIVGREGVLPAVLVNAQTPATDGGSLFAVNDGVGPAIVRRVEVLLDGKPMADWPSVFRALGYAHQPGATSAFDGAVLPPGKQLYLLAVTGQDRWVALGEKIRRSLVVRTCYCSTLGECWMYTMKEGVPLNKRTQPIRSCSEIPQKDVFNG